MSFIHGIFEIAYYVVDTVIAPNDLKLTTAVYKNAICSAFIPNLT